MSTQRQQHPDRQHPDRQKLLHSYLRHHYAASHGGVAFFERAARTSTDPTTRAELTRLTAEVAEDQAALLGVLEVLQVSRRPWEERLVSMSERLGRLKPNGTVLRRSPLTDVVELEALGTALHAKLLGWLSLRELSDHDARLNHRQFDLLAERARNQKERVEDLRLAAVRRALGPEVAP
jgi:hypothetical protein